MNSLILNLSKTSVFRNIKLGELEKIFSSLDYRIENYGRREFIKFSGEEYDELLIVLKGEACTQMEDSGGKVMMIEVFYESEEIAPAVLFTEKRSLPVNLISRTESSILCIKKNSFLKAAVEHGNLLSNLLELMGNKVMFLANKVRMLQFSSLKQKIALFILESMKRNGKEEFEMDFNREEMSELFSVARPSLSRAFGELVQDGIIITDGKFVKILDQTELKKITEL